MSDKQQLAAMGEHLAEQQPMCMDRRIEELEAQVEKLTNRMAWRNTGSPNGLRRFMTQKQYDAQTPGVQKWYEPIRYEAPEDWELVPVEPTQEMILAGVAAQAEKLKRYALGGSLHPIDHGMPDAYSAMIAASPSPDGAK